MDILLSKLLPVFAYPLGAALVGLLLAFALGAAGRKRASLALLVLAIVGLWGASMPFVANQLSNALERQVPVAAIADVPEADVVVLLGGMLGPPPAGLDAPELSGSIDRAVHAAHLYRAGKAGHILVTGGNLPWKQAQTAEGILIADFLADLGIPRDAIVVESASRNTRENAVNTLPILAQQGWTRAILVTSAAHMPRALATFAAVGIDATPAPTDFRGRAVAVESALDFLPDAGSLAATTDVLKEVLGLFVYRMRGWA